MKKLIIIIGCLLVVNNSIAQELGLLINEALENNPEIQKYELQYAIASEKVNEVNTIPDTEFGLGYFVSQPETGTGPQRFRASVSQMFPWFGSITARENYMSTMADATYQDVAIAKRRLTASVAQSYYNLYELEAKRKVLSENISLLKTYETLALTSVSVGKASVVDVLRLQMRQNELDRLDKVVEQQIKAEQKAVNELMNRSELKAIEISTELVIPDENELDLTSNLEVHPELIKFDKLYESVDQSELLNQKERSPMFAFGVDYIAVSERTDMNPIDNGKDIVMPMVSVSIPIFNKKYRSQTIQNTLRQQELVSEKQLRLNNLETMLEKALSSRKAARISYEAQTNNLKQAKDAEEILLKSYETGTIDFNDVLDIQELQLKFQMSMIESVTSYYLQTTIINYLSN